MDDPQTTNPRHARVDGHGDCVKAVHTVVAQAKRELRVFDADLANQDWNSIARNDLLRNFLLASRNNRIFIVVHDASYIARECPRLQQLLRQFSHALAIHETAPHIKGVSDPLVIADDMHHFHRFHLDAWRGLLALDDPQGTQDMLQRYNQIWEASFPAVTATTLGL